MPLHGPALAGLAGRQTGSVCPATNCFEKVQGFFPERQWNGPLQTFERAVFVGGSRLLGRIANGTGSPGKPIGDHKDLSIKKVTRRKGANLHQLKHAGRIAALASHCARRINNR